LHKHGYRDARAQSGLRSGVKEHHEVISTDKNYLVVGTKTTRGVRTRGGCRSAVGGCMGIGCTSTAAEPASASASASGIDQSPLGMSLADLGLNTCRFHTRIDWILLPPRATLSLHHPRLECTVLTTSGTSTSSSNNNNSTPHSSDSSSGFPGYKVINTMNITDHNLVTATLHFTMETDDQYLITI